MSLRFCHFGPRPCSSFTTMEDLRTEDRWFELLAQPVFFPRIEDSHCNRIHSSLTAVHYFNDNFVGKQPVSWKEYCAEYWLKEFQESMDRCNGCHNVTEITLKTGIKHHAIN